MATDDNGYVPSDERIFGWMSTDFDDSGWGEVSTAQTGGPLSTEHFPDPDAVAFEPIFPGERSLYRRRLIAVEGGAGPARMALAAAVNTSVTVWLDGLEVMRKKPGQRGLVEADVPYMECDQQLAVVVIGEPPFAGRWGWTWMRLEEPDDPDDDWVYGGALRRTYDPAQFPDADSPWLSYEGDLPYPGVSAGFILRTLFDEAKARGFIGAITTDFDASTDSAGRPWPRVAGPGSAHTLEFACQVGADTVLDVAERLADHDVDVEMTPGLVFRAFHRRGVDRGLTPADGAATVTIPLDVAREVATDTEDENINTLMVRTKDAWIIRPEEPPTVNRREGFLSLGLMPSDEGAARAGDKVVSDFSAPRQGIQFAVHSGLIPLRPTVDYDLGDTIVGPRVDPDNFVADWRLDDVRVDALGARIDLTGEVDWVHEISPPEE